MLPGRTLMEQQRREPYGSPPILSITIPTYNRGEKLYNMLSEILPQTDRKDFEIVISDNCSTDNSIEFLKKIEDDRIKILEASHNVGSFLNSVKCIKNCSGKYVTTFMDRDAIIFDHIDRILDILSATDTPVGYFYPNWGKRKLSVKTVCGVVNCLNTFGYLCAHPSGVFYLREYLLNVDIERFQREDLACFSSDYIMAELCRYGKGMIVKIPFCHMMRPPFDDLKRSTTYNPQKGNLFFTPENRFKTFENFVQHLETMGLPEKDRRRVLNKIVFRTYNYSTYDYLQILSDEPMCAWYGVTPCHFDSPQPEIKKLTKQLLNRFRDSSVFKSEDEKRRVILLTRIIALNRHRKEIIIFMRDAIKSCFRRKRNRYTEPARRKRV
jgi:glycosyltransferase involved in cell wall biosynthesis